MVQVLGDILKVNSIHTFPQPLDKPNAFLRVKEDESGCELVDINYLKNELSGSSKDSGCIVSQTSIPYTVIRNVTTDSTPYTVMSSANALPVGDINTFFSTGVTFEAGQSFPLEIAQEGEYKEGYYKFNIETNGAVKIYVTYDRNGLQQTVPTEFPVRITRPFKRITYRFDSCSGQLIAKANLQNITTKLQANECNLDVVFGDGQEITFAKLNDLDIVPFKHFERITSNFPKGRYYFKPTGTPVSVTFVGEVTPTEIASTTYFPTMYLEPFTSVQNATAYLEEDGQIVYLEDFSNGKAYYIQESQNLFLRKDGTCYPSNNKVYMQLSEPENPNIGDRWYDTRQLPLICLKWDGNDWEDCQEVCIGSVNLTDGIADRFIESILNYNGTLIPKNMQWTFEGNGFAYHNLNIIPENFTATSPDGNCWLSSDMVGLIGSNAHTTFTIKAN